MEVLSGFAAGDLVPGLVTSACRGSADRSTDLAIVAPSSVCLVTPLLRPSSDAVTASTGAAARCSLGSMDVAMGLCVGLDVSPKSRYITILKNTNQ